MEYHRETLREFNRKCDGFVKRHQKQPSTLLTIFKLFVILTRNILNGGMPPGLYLQLCERIRTKLYDLLEVNCKDDKEYLQICYIAKGLKVMFDETVDIYLYLQTA